MIQTCHQMYCETEGCKAHTANDSLFDGAIWTPAQVRQICKDMGWKRIKGHDYCPNCAETMRRAA
jgi:hypothetical protein